MDYDELDFGIRNLVEWLNSEGFNTTDSGDGCSKPAAQRDLDIPHVAIVPSQPKYLWATADRLYTRLQTLPLTKCLVPGSCGQGVDTEVSIEATYNPADGSAVVMLYGLDDEGAGL